MAPSVDSRFAAEVQLDWLPQLQKPVHEAAPASVRPPYAGVYAYTPELFPTWMRATGVGLASAVGRIGSILGQR